MREKRFHAEAIAAALPPVVRHLFLLFVTRIISSFADSVAIHHLSFLTFDYDKFRETLERTRFHTALRVSTSRTNAVQSFFRRIYKGKEDRVSYNTNGNFSSILLRYALAPKSFRAK